MAIIEVYKDIRDGARAAALLAELTINANVKTKKTGK